MLCWFGVNAHWAVKFVGSEAVFTVIVAGDQDWNFQTPSRSASETSASVALTGLVCVK